MVQKTYNQVSSKLTSITEEKETRYDVTLFVNGLPLIQIELKARGKTLKEAVNQIERYRRTSYKELYKFIQIYVVSNGVNTKIFCKYRWRDLILAIHFSGLMKKTIELVI